MKISILGDSLSTFEGYNPFSYAVYYTAERAAEEDMDVNDTWWMLVLRALGAELCVNGSFAGSFAAGESTASGCSDERIRDLSEEGNLPDAVWVWIGTNDCGGRVPLHGQNPDDRTAFDTAYALMLRKIRRDYPKAEIVCLTPMPTEEELLENNRRAVALLQTYGNAVREAAASAGCAVIDLADGECGYATADRLHPNKKGHRQIAEAILARWRKGTK